MCKAAHFTTAFIAASLALAVLFAPGQVYSHENHTPLIPLHSGDLWVYLNDEGAREIVRVGLSAAEEHWYDARLENYMFGISTEDVYFFHDKCGRTCEVNPRVRWQGRPAPIEDLYGPWYPCQGGCFEVKETKLPTMGMDCFNGIRGELAEVGTPFKVPAGVFPWSVTISYDPSTNETQCFDRQVTSETLVPDIGLVQRVVRTGESAETWTLCMAIIQGKVIGDPNGCVFERGLAPVEETTWGQVKAAFGN